MIKNRHNGNWCCFFGRWRKLFNLFSGKISLTKLVSKEAASVCITKKEKKNPAHIWCNVLSWCKPECSIGLLCNSYWPCSGCPLPLHQPGGVKKSFCTLCWCPCLHAVRLRKRRAVRYRASHWKHLASIVLLRHLNHAYWVAPQCLCYVAGLHKLLSKTRIIFKAWIFSLNYRCVT